MISSYFQINFPWSKMRSLKELILQDCSQSLVIDSFSCYANSSESLAILAINGVFTEETELIGIRKFVNAAHVLRNLIDFTFSHNSLSEESYIALLKVMFEWPALVSLYLGGDSIISTEDAFDQLEKTVKELTLTKLYLPECDLDDSHIEHIIRLTQNMPNFELLALQRNRFTEDGCAKLREAVCTEELVLHI